MENISKDMASILMQTISTVGIGGRITDVIDNGSYINAKLQGGTIDIILYLDINKNLKDTLRRYIQGNTSGWKAISSELISKLTGYDVDALQSTKYTDYNSLYKSIVLTHIDGLLDLATDSDVIDMLRVYGNYKGTIKVNGTIWHIISKNYSKHVR